MGTSRPAGGSSIVIMASIVAALALGALASCTGRQAGEGPATPSVGGVSGSPQVSPSAKPVTDYSSFIHGLEAGGSTVREGERTGGDLFTVSGQTIFIDDVQASVYEYPSESALDEVRSSVSRDGYSIPTRTGGIAIVEWVGTPHLYSAGKLLVVYVGDKQRTLRTLDLLLGPQFAGG